jgi:hypothetical protein
MLASSQTHLRRAISLVGVCFSCVSLAVAPGCNAIVGNDSFSTVTDEAGADGMDERADSQPGDAPGDRGTGPSDAHDGSPMDSRGFDSPAEVAQDSGLSPLLVLPPSSDDTACDPAEQAAGDTVCPSGETCRISSVTGGLCDPYTGCEGHEAGYPCTFDSDCDETLTCYKGECFVQCLLGQDCAGGCECFSVGNESTGLCCPGM